MNEPANNSPDSLTAIHRMVARCRAGDFVSMVARLPSGWVILGERQVFTGYCLLLPDPVVRQLNSLAGGARAQFLTDMARVGDALLAVTAALRINYAIYGNIEPALHAHIFPRYADEPAATRTAQPWALDWSRAPEYSPAEHGDVQRRITAQLKSGSSD
jgi:diadenosine tetraphosphate (Ap4A) HIT family hydrolase